MIDIEFSKLWEEMKKKRFWGRNIHDSSFSKTFVLVSHTAVFNRTWQGF